MPKEGQAQWTVKSNNIGVITGTQKENTGWDIDEIMLWNNGSPRSSPVV